MKGNTVLDITSLGMVVVYLLVIVAGAIGVLSLVVLLFKEKPDAIRNGRARPKIGSAFEQKDMSLAPVSTEITHQQDRAA